MIPAPPANAVPYTISWYRGQLVFALKLAINASRFPSFALELGVIFTNLGSPFNVIENEKLVLSRFALYRMYESVTEDRGI